MEGERVGYGDEKIMGIREGASNGALSPSFLRKHLKGEAPRGGPVSGAPTAGRVGAHMGGARI